MLYSGHRTMSEEGRSYGTRLIEFARRMGTEFVVIHPTNEYEGD
jgi:sugar phosphate isomerase/epimerase